MPPLTSSRSISALIVSLSSLSTLLQNETYAS